MKVYKRTASTVGMFLSLALLVLGVMRLPQAYGSYSDRRTLDRPEYMTNEMKVFACDYASMEEKLQDIAFYQARSIELAEVVLPVSGNAEASDDEMAVYVQEEMDQMWELGILNKRIDLSEYDLSVRELHGLYPGNGDRLRGQISFWFLIYESKRSMLYIQMDTEYHKIYTLKVEASMAAELCREMEQYVNQEMVGRNRSGTEMAQGLTGALAEGYMEYYNMETAEIGLQEEEPLSDFYTDSGAIVEEAKGDMGAYAQKAFEQIAVGDSAWDFELQEIISMKENSRLRVWERYSYSDEAFATGILWDL